eukprot:g22590.t1
MECFLLLLVGFSSARLAVTPCPTVILADSQIDSTNSPAHWRQGMTQNSRLPEMCGNICTTYHQLKFRADNEFTQTGPFTAFKRVLRLNLSY